MRNGLFSARKWQQVLMSRNVWTSSSTCRCDLHTQLSITAVTLPFYHATNKDVFFEFAAYLRMWQATKIIVCHDRCSYMYIAVPLWYIVIPITSGLSIFIRYLCRSEFRSVRPSVASSNFCPRHAIMSCAMWQQIPGHATGDKSYHLCVMRALAMHHVMIGGNFNARYQGFLTPLWLWWPRVCQGLLMVLCWNLLSYEYSLNSQLLCTLVGV